MSALRASRVDAAIDEEDAADAMRAGRTVIVERRFQLGATSNLSVRGAHGFRRTVLADRKMQREGGDCQGISYEVSCPEDAIALGAEDTVSGWYLRGLDLVVQVRS